MEATLPSSSSDANTMIPTRPTRHVVNPGEFRMLMISHRRMIRADLATERLKGLRDLDSGELFLVEERRLLDR